MDRREREEERQRLKRAIEDWNASRLDLFEITPPDPVSQFCLTYLYLSFKCN